MMPHLWFLIWTSIGLSMADQFYDSTLCSSDVDRPGTRYICNNYQEQCQTFLVYRANEKFQTILNISSLFNMIPEQLLANNLNVSSSFQILDPGREILVPINCFCSDQYYQARLDYIFVGKITVTDIGCEVFEGLVKPITLIEGNSSANATLQVGSMLHVPLKCACPDEKSSALGVKYLVTYPIVEEDDTDQMSKKFNIPVNDILEANHLDPSPTVYPNTTVLLPLKEEPSINFEPPDSDPPTPGFLPTVPIETSGKRTELKKVYISVSVVGSVLVLVTLVACGLYMKALKKYKAESHNSFMHRSPMTSFSTPRSSQVSGPSRTPKSSTTSCLSPDVLESIKYSLCIYSLEELKRATNDFSEDTKISHDVYKGLIDDIEILIKQTRFDDTRQVIDVYSRINHVNIVKLLGVCYGDSDFSWSYLVFEFPTNGYLRGCLSSSTASLRWPRRTQIAFDIATGLHYLHYCMVPPYSNLCVNSKTIFLTRNWRAKLAVFGNMTVAGSSKDHETLTSNGGWITPDHFPHGSVSEKEDIFAFGAVLLELISAKEDQDWKLSKESITFLGGGTGERGCFDQLRNFIDPSLQEDYPLAEALCLAVLAKACVEDDPLHRPSMDDIIKVLARMV